MRSLSSLICVLLYTAIAFAQSPHGNSIKIDCSNCHESTTWKIKGAVQYDHNQTGFVLTGQHKNAKCQSCHTTLVFTEAKSDCFSCHKDIHQNSVGFDCQKCHTTDTWIVKDIQRVHKLGRFPLTGAHQRAECTQCHKGFSNLNFQPIGISCYSCHANDFASAKNPDHIAAKFSSDCQDCHQMTDNTWAAKNFIHDFFPLTGMHKIANCFSCHAQGGSFSGLSKDCYSCHQKDFIRATDPNHVTGNFSHDCTQCHSINNSFNNSTFNHSVTNFPLTGVHASVQCASCHQSGYQNTSINCVSCHQQNYNNAANPNHVTLALSTDCQTCHTTTNAGFKPASFPVHNNYYQLIGAHAAIASNCATCHTTTNYGNTPNTCIGCHQQKYNNTTNPPHASTGFGIDCVSCHNQTAWQPATFNHDQQYFPIYSGKHNGKWNVCSDCHTNSSNYNVFSCINCHEHSKSAMDNEHQGITGYVWASAQCYTCHPRGTKEGAFNHATTNFPLTGVHLTVSCAQCHTNGYAGTSMLCVSCHQQNYNNAVNPNHVTLALSTDCQTCHTMTYAGFKPASFPVHNNYYQLLGAHAAIANNCATCHTTTNYSNTPNTCVGCHQLNYNTTTNPPHASTGFGTDCVSCHNQTAWQPATFNHDQQYFPIYSGKHNGKWNVCSDCHTNASNYNVFTCINCHAHNKPDMDSEHQGITGYVWASPQCYACHPRGTKEGAFNHSTTNFPLTGAHITLSCLQCHANGYVGTSMLCVSCHQANYNAAVNPNHTTAGISTDCKACHNTTAFTPSTFNHSTTTFPLTGAHVVVQQCSSCHVGTTTGTSPLCVSCHLAKYNAAVNPNHIAAGISTNCQPCHTTTAFAPSTFNHSTTTFPLTGAHVVVPQCSSCHVGTTTGTSPLCVSCHQAQYNAAVNPNHTAAGISTDCKACHTTTAYIPSTFNHTATGFALTGHHLTIQCSSCHVGTTTGASPLCISCHQQQFNTAPGHVAQSYPTACEMCHNSTLWNQTNFNHQTTQFPLTGAHISVTCSNCHITGYTGTPTACVSCHLAKFNATTNPNHVTLALSTTCQTCHTTNPAWQPATFPVHNTFFQLIGAHASIANNCTTCHHGNYNTTPNTCYGCHQTDFTSATNPNHVTPGFSHDCTVCHTQSVWQPSTFSHVPFQIYTGKHRNKWTTCGQCHPNSANYQEFSCFGCHSQNSMNNEHQNVTGYVYQNAACYNCHPTGNGDKFRSLPSDEKIN